MKNIQNLINFSQSLVNYDHTTANYYEDKKYKFLQISAIILGFSATFFGIFRERLFLSLGALCLMFFSILSILFYVIRSRPSREIEFEGSLRSLALKGDIKKNIESYLKKLKRMREEDILKENAMQAVILLSFIKSKRNTIYVMSWLLGAGMLFFFLFALMNFLA